MPTLGRRSFLLIKLSFRRGALRGSLYSRLREARLCASVPPQCLRQEPWFCRRSPEGLYSSCLCGAKAPAPSRGKQGFCFSRLRGGKVPFCEICAVFKISAEAYAYHHRRARIPPGKLHRFKHKIHKIVL